MKKTKVTTPILATLLLLAMISVANVIFPVYATSQSVQIESYYSCDVNGEVAYVTRYDIIQYGKHFVRMQARTSSGAWVNSTLIPYELLNPQKLKTRFQSVAPLAFHKYDWDNVVFVKAPGDETRWVKYDHPDNYETYFPGQININYAIKGHHKTHFHVAQWIIEDCKSKSVLGPFVSAVVSVAVALLALPEPLISKFTASVLGLIVAVCTFLGVAMNIFFGNILQTELGDGWVWIWGEGGAKINFLWWSWWMASWFWASFGSLRDFGFFFFIPFCGGGGGPPSSRHLMR